VSVIDAQRPRSTPGWIRNDGFAVAWAEPAPADANRPPGSRQAWATNADQRRRHETWRGNQDLHGEARTCGKRIRSELDHNPAVRDPLDPGHVVKKINVRRSWGHGRKSRPGAICADSASALNRLRFRKWFTFTNGRHIRTLDPYNVHGCNDSWKAVRRRNQPNRNQAAERVRRRGHLPVGRWASPE